MSNIPKSRYLVNFSQIDVNERTIKPDFYEKVGSFCLAPLRTLRGHTYSYSRHKYELNPSSTLGKCAAAAFLVFGCFIAVPMTGIGFLATWKSKSHEQEFQSFSVAQHLSSLPPPPQDQATRT